MGSGGAAKIIEKTILKPGTQKGGHKGENEWPEPQSDRAGVVQTQFATFCENLKFHRKCLHLGSHFRSFLVPFSCLFPKRDRRGPGPRLKVLKRHQNGPQRIPKWSPGLPKWSPEVAQSVKKAPSCIPRVPKWRPRCHNGAPRSPKVKNRHHLGPKSATKTPKCAPRCQKTITHRHKQPTHQGTK